MNLRYFLFAIAATAFMACDDEIDSDNRYIELPPVEVKRNVLIEDFTGQNCPNCPKAHEVTNMLMNQYGNSVITVAIHAGGFAWSENSTMPFPTFKTPDGDVYANAAGVTDYPSGVINRNSGVIQPSDWSTKVTAELNRPTIMDIELLPVFNADSTEITVQTTLSPSDNILGKLQIWVTENGIISRQKNGNSWITDYEHNHVYRASVNEVGGEDVTLRPRESQTFEHKQTVRDYWNAKNLAIVAFVYNADGVLQVVEQIVK